MAEALEAYGLAIAYANSHLAWYDSSAFWTLWLFRVAGIVAIVSSTVVTALSALIDKSARTRIVVASVSAVSTVAIALAAFFGWGTSWEAHRTAHLELQAIVKIADIRKLELQAQNNVKSVFELAGCLSVMTEYLVLSETRQYFSQVSEISGAPRGAQAVREGNDKSDRLPMLIEYQSDQEWCRREFFRVSGGETVR